MSWHKKNNKWQIQININGKQKSIGYFDDEIMGAIAYDFAAIESFGEFARLNFNQ